jgi:hypothetical protein
MTVARIAIGCLPGAFLLLLLRRLPVIVAFTLLMGASQGVITIVRGAVPPRSSGGKVTARGAPFATPILIVNAASRRCSLLIVDRRAGRRGRRCRPSPPPPRG